MPNWLPTPAALATRPSGIRPDPGLERPLRACFAIGLLAVLLVPALRGSSAWLGWWPLWLVAMPGSAWWALHRFRLPSTLWAMRVRRRRNVHHSQARRRTPRRMPARTAAA